MDRINQEEAERGRPRLCGRDMLDWDRAAVDNFLILRTDDTDLLDHLLWFGEEHLGLLRTVHPGIASLDYSFADSTMVGSTWAEAYP